MSLNFPFLILTICDIMGDQKALPLAGGVGDDVHQTLDSYSHVPHSQVSVSNVSPS